MEHLKLLDCTLRDGGYINDWNFGKKAIQSIINGLVNSGIDLIEVGFLRNCNYNENRTLYNNIQQLKGILPRNRGNSGFVVMALHNLYDINKLEDNDGTIDGIRVTFHDYDIDRGLDFCKSVIEKGYKCYCNPINIMGYSDMQILKIIEKVNLIKPYAFSIVDTFGSMQREDLLRIYALAEHNLDKSITVGLHLHENLSLSFSLAQAFVENCSGNRQSVIDGSLLGMGRVPGNLCIELIMDYLNKQSKTNYDIDPVLDIIDDHIVKLKEKSPWGYSTAYALSARFNLHRNYAEYLLSKGKLRAKNINHILASIAPEKKTAFDKEYIEQLYFNYQDIKIDDSDEILNLKSCLNNRVILIIAPGSSIKTQQAKINQFILENRPIIISANFISQICKPDYAFFTNMKRYEENKAFGDCKVIITSNLSNIATKYTIMLNYHDLAFGDAKSDNNVILLLRLLKRIDVTKVFLAGFDGYIEDKENYFDSSYSNAYLKGTNDTAELSDMLCAIRETMHLTFLTESLYEKGSQNEQY